MNKTVSAARRQAKSNTRVIARNLRAARRQSQVSLTTVRDLERSNYMPTGHLFLALAGIKLNFSDLFLLTREFDITFTDALHGTEELTVAA